MKKKHYNYRPNEKVANVKRHLVDKIPLSDVCDHYHLQPTAFYRRQKEFYSNGVVVFDKPKKGIKDQKSRRIRNLKK